MKSIARTFQKLVAAGLQSGRGFVIPDQQEQARVTTWTYNAYRGWLDNKQYPDSRGPSYLYTPAGRLQTRTWARSVAGQQVTTTYGFGPADELGNLGYPANSCENQGISFTPCPPW